MSFFTRHSLLFCGWLLACLVAQSAVAQTTFPAAPGSDTMRIIQIVKGKSLREITIDSANVIETIAGNVELREGLTIFFCDSAVIYRKTNIMEAYGNIHINQNDSIHTYSQYLKYIGADRMAYLKKDVKLTDKKGILYTQELEYDLKTGIAKYSKGGKVVNGKTILTSNDGVYYAETKDVFFKNNVHLIDPKYTISNDTLLYNTITQIASWNTPTYIKSKNGGDIYSSNGTYDLKQGKAFFGNRTIIKDSTRTYVADKSAYDEASGIAQLEGNAVVKDSVNGYTVLGGQIFLDKNTNSFLATRKPVLIFKGDGKDSTFIAADTLYSGIEKRDKDGNKIIQRDTLKKTTIVSVSDSGRIETIAIDSANRGHLKDTMASKAPSLPAADSASKPIKTVEPVKAVKQPAAAKPLVTPTPPLIALQPVSDSLANQSATDSMGILMNRINSTKVDSNFNLKDSVKKAPKDTAIRFFLAFHHVRIYNDSLQAVCDSLFYSSEDSTFRLFNDPLLFSNNSQVAGDTMYIYTVNKKAKRVYVFNNGILINKINQQMYNQMGGRTINAYFKDGAIDYTRIKGSPAESVFYPQDDDSAYIGLNRSKGDVIDVYFVDKQVNRIKFINDVDGTLFPMRRIPEDQKYLNKFKWLDSRRPKNKFELFE